MLRWIDAMVKSNSISIRINICPTSEPFIVHLPSQIQNKLATPLITMSKKHSNKMESSLKNSKSKPFKKPSTKKAISIGLPFYPAWENHWIPIGLKWSKKSIIIWILRRKGRSITHSSVFVDLFSQKIQCQRIFIIQAQSKIKRNHLERIVQLSTFNSGRLHHQRRIH